MILWRPYIPMRSPFGGQSGFILYTVSNVTPNRIAQGAQEAAAEMEREARCECYCLPLLLGEVIILILTPLS